MQTLLVKIFAAALAFSQVTTAPDAVRTQFDRARDHEQVAQLLGAGCSHMRKAFDIEDIDLEDLIATALDDPQAVGESRMFPPIRTSAHQVLHNRERYATRDRLTTLGWSEIEVIDDDLGRSAAGGVQRAGFERMVAQVCLGKVGAVAAREVSRFARNSRDWQQLIEMCRVVDTVLVDQETVYAPRHGNDRLLLGLKGSLNEYELDLFCGSVRSPHSNSSTDVPKYASQRQHALWQSNAAHRMTPWFQIRRICQTVGFLVFLLTLSACSVAVAAEPKRVMLLHSFGRDFKPWSEYAKSIRAELERQSPWPLDITDHSLVTARSSDEDPEGPFVEYLRALFAKHPLDLIVSIGAPAAAFVQRQRQRLFANTPMVFTAVEQRRVQYSTLTANDAVVAVWINYLAAMENILRVLPDTKSVVVVVGTSPIEKFWRDAIGKEVEALSSRVRFSWTDHLSFDELLTQAAALPPQSAIFWELMIVDAAGIVHEGGTPLTRLHAVANAPIFSYDEAFFGREIVGGPLLLVADTSRQTAAVAIRILGGEKPGDVKTPPVQFARPMFDWREMQRWGISEGRLPPGSEIFFRDPTAWDKYRLEILAVCAILLVQGALISWLIYEHRRRSRAEVLARNSMSELMHMNRVATAGELSASIAHEVTQPLTGIVARVGAARRWLAAEKPDLDKVRAALDQIETAGHRASDIVTNVRSMFKRDTSGRTAVDINRVIWMVMGLVDIDLRKQQIELKTELDDQLPAVLGNRVQLQQVILNLIMNAIDAMRSVPARVLSVKTTLDGCDGVHVSIADTGIGIDPTNVDQIFKPLFTTKEYGMGMGLSICRSIIESHNGRIWVSAGHERGSIFHLVLPTDGRGG